MPLRTLLVCLIDMETADATMACAVQLARMHNAHLVGLHVLDALVVYPGIAVHLTQDVYAAFHERQLERARGIEAIFARHTDREDFVSEWRMLQAQATSAAERIVDSARMADLVMMPNATTARDQDKRVQARVIREAGRPVIVVPGDYAQDNVGTRLVLGWSDTREATRAAHDLLIAAAPDAELSVLRIGKQQGDVLKDFELNEFAALYDRHGLKAKTAHLDRDGDDIAEVLLRYAFEDGADLVVTGAFGHSRAYDFVLGAVTQGLLRDAKVPVLFSH